MTPPQFSRKELVLRRSTNGAGTCASAAGNASVSIDAILAVALRDSTDRALSSASAAGDAIVRNLICHVTYLLVVFDVILTHILQKINR